MIHLVLGGARSGKSAFAESLALNWSDKKDCSDKKVIYIATATAEDEEMTERIEHHQQNRSNDWVLEEEPLNLSELIKCYTNKESKNDDIEARYLLIIECMTLWLTNWLCSAEPEKWIDEKQAFIRELINSQDANTETDIIIVSNEVGSGIIPMGELSRDFVDQSGWLNQELAKIANRVTLVVAGCDLILK